MKSAPPFLIRKSKYVVILLILFSLFFYKQSNAQHLVGIKAGYAISGVNWKPVEKIATVSTPLNVSLLYTYYHNLWGNLPYFGIQTGINYAEQGFTLINDNKTYHYRVVEVPVVSQFHIDFWKMRLLINLGAFAGYRLSATEQTINEENDATQDLVFDCNDKRFDYGFIGGGGLAFRLKPVELHLECNYQYSLSMLYNPKKFSNDHLFFVYPHQLIFSVGIFLQL